MEKTRKGATERIMQSAGIIMGMRHDTSDHIFCRDDSHQLIRSRCVCNLSDSISKLGNTFFDIFARWHAPGDGRMAQGTSFGT
ncbi:unnamed protein product [Caenorhabditis auriculariae]|uniref:Uncharacterized protein n=1 Tax=Caenorhabditis auriculariae TaxID=2777116 RepID=A0A8S1GUI5_9PELO|nr:unnamed protein product [Caenorhabditis auriculariae]